MGRWAKCAFQEEGRKKLPVVWVQLGVSQWSRPLDGLLQHRGSGDRDEEVDLRYIVELDSIGLTNGLHIKK